MICKVCGETVSEEVLPTNNNHAYYNGKCLLCGAEETVACEHNYEIVKEEAATCGESGYVWTKCSKCGWEKNYETDPIADAHDYEVVKKLDATCLEGGYVWTRCSICGWEKNYETDPVSNIHVVGENGKCTTCGREMAEFVCEHENSTLLNTVEPDCYYTGVELWKCDDCNATYTVELPATGVHAFENGVCTVCGIDEPAEEPEETPDKEPEETPDEKPEETPGKQPEQTPDEKPVETPDQEPEETPNQEDSSAELDNVPKTGSFLLEWLFALIFG